MTGDPFTRICRMHSVPQEGCAEYDQDRWHEEATAGTAEPLETGGNHARESGGVNRDPGIAMPKPANTENGPAAGSETSPHVEPEPIVWADGASPFTEHVQRHLDAYGNRVVPAIELRETGLCSQLAKSRTECEALRESSTILRAEIAKWKQRAVGHYRESHRISQDLAETQTESESLRATAARLLAERDLARVESAEAMGLELRNLWRLTTL